MTKVTSTSAVLAILLFTSILTSGFAAEVRPMGKDRLDARAIGAVVHEPMYKDHLDARAIGAVDATEEEGSVVEKREPCLGLLGGVGVGLGVPGVGVGVGLDGFGTGVRVGVPGVGVGVGFGDPVEEIRGGTVAVQQGAPVVVAGGGGGAHASAEADA